MTREFAYRINAQAPGSANRHGQHKSPDPPSKQIGAKNRDKVAGESIIDRSSIASRYLKTQVRILHQTGVAVSALFVIEILNFNTFYFDQ